MLNSLNNPHTQLRDRLGEVQAWLGEKAAAFLVMGRGAHNDFGPENNDASQRNNEGDNQGYRTKRVGFVVTFRLFGAEKSVLKLVGANLKDGQNVLVLWRLFGLLVRENPH